MPPVCSFFVSSNGLNYRIILNTLRTGEDCQKTKKLSIRFFVKTIHMIFLLISIIVGIGLPFLWFGVIEEPGKSGGM